MRKYAVLDANVVKEILDLDDDGVAFQASRHQLVIDITDLLIQPQIGWMLVGNQLAPAPGQAVALKDLIKARIKYYQDNASDLLRDLYAQNTMLGITAEESDQMFSDYSDVLMRIREGAWPTALYRLAQKQPAGFVTQQMLDNWIALIQSRML